VGKTKSIISILSIFLWAAGCHANVEQLDQPVDQAESGKVRPNIIFILADDLGYGHLGSYGQQDIETPELDQLASDGLRYTQAYAGSTVCAPSRSVLMTGQHTGHTTVRGNWGPDGERVPLKDSDVTVAEVLQSAGYKTGMIGKWGLGEPGTSGLPNKQGFDYWFGFLNQHNAHSFYLQRERDRTKGDLCPGSLPG
jgi:arylsulfatase A-like enzyme